MSTDTINEVRQRAEDAAYTAVGIGVLGFQQAQARGKAASARLATAGREAKGRAASLRDDARAAAESLGSEVKQRVEPVVDQLTERVDPLVADVRARVAPVLERLGQTARRAAGSTGSDATSWQADTKPASSARVTTKATSTTRRTA